MTTAGEKKCSGEPEKEDCCCCVKYDYRFDRSSLRMGALEHWGTEYDQNAMRGERRGEGTSR